MFSGTPTPRSNAEGLDLILRRLPITISAQDADLHYTWVTNALFGLTAEAVLGKTDAELLPEASAARLSELKRAVLERGEGVHTDVGITRDGDEQIYDLAIEPLRDEAGALCGVLCAALDVTGRRRLEAQLQHSQALLQGLVDHAPAIILVKDLAERYVLVNRRLATLLDRDPASILGRTTADLFPPEIAAAMSANDRQVLSTGRPIEVEERIPVGGELHTQLAMIFPIADGQGATRALGLVATDITERTVIEQALRESEARFRAVAELVPDMLWSIDPQGGARWYNQRWLDYTGQSLPESVNVDWLEVVHPNDTASVRARFLESVARGTPLRHECRIRGADGAYRWFLLQMQPVRDDGEQVTQWLGAATDVHEQRMALRDERAARAASEHAALRIARLQTATAALSEARTPAEVAEVIITHARDDLGAGSCTVRLISPDRRTLDLVGSEGVPQELIGGWEQTPMEAATPITVVAQTGEPLFYESRLAVSRDHPVIAELIAPLGIEASAVVPLKVEGRTIGSLSLTFGARRAFSANDRGFIAALAGLGAQALDRARLYSAAQEAVAARDTFIAVASHDLRAPLTAILAQAQLLERQAARAGLDAQVVRWAQQIGAQSRRLNRLIDAILDLARIQSGQLTLDLAPCDLAELAARVAAETQLTTGHHMLAVQGADEPLWVLGDALRLEQVLRNLIENAVKYSPGGGTVRVLLSRAQGQARVAVVDQGIGIPADALPRLFSRFYRAPNVAAYGIRGLGIGLYAVREILLLHGGDVAVTSAEWGGSTFTVVLPLAETTPEPAAPRDGEG